MKKIVLVASLLAGAMSVPADMVAYQATALNTPQAGYSGRVACVQFASTNSAGTATVGAVTDLLVGGSTVSFTNVLATAALTNGVATVAPEGVYVAPRQRIVVYGDAFPGGSATVWLTR